MLYVIALTYIRCLSPYLVSTHIPAGSMYACTLASCVGVVHPLPTVYACSDELQ